MSQASWIFLGRVVVCGLMWQRYALGQELPPPNPAPAVPMTVAPPVSAGAPGPIHEPPTHTPMCPAGWEQPFAQAEQATVWIETYFTNGTGVLLSKDIVAVAARLAVPDYGSILVRFGDDTTLEATVIYVEPVSGLALLKLERPAPVAAPDIGQVSDVPLLAPLMAVTHPRNSYTTPNSKFARAVPHLLARGKVVDATTFTVQSAAPNVIGAPVFGCDARLYGLIVQHDSDGTLAASRKALLEALTLAGATPYRGSHAYWFEGTSSGFSFGPNPKFGVMIGFEIFYWRRFRVVTNGGLGLGRTKGGTFVDLAAGYRWALPRVPIFFDLDVGGGVGRVDVDERRKLCVKESCDPVGTATRSYVLGRFSLAASWLVTSFTLRVDPARGDVGPVVFMGLGLPTELSEAFRKGD